VNICVVSENHVMKIIHPSLRIRSYDTAITCINGSRSRVPCTNESRNCICHVGKKNFVKEMLVFRCVLWGNSFFCS
jgi:hypothetical protein